MSIFEEVKEIFFLKPILEASKLFVLFIHLRPNLTCLIPAYQYQLIRILYIILMNSQSEAQARNSIKAFEFKKFNKSVLNRLALDPLSDWVSQKLPQTISANVISVTSLLLTFLNFCLVSLLGPSRPAYLATALLLFSYQLIDNLNQKQAIRRLENSLLTIYVDHLCDALSSSFIALTMASLMGFEHTGMWFSLLAFSLIPYYVQHLKMYYSGELELEIVNPVDQGLVFLQLLCWIGFFAGPDVFQTPTILSMPLNYFLACLFTILLLAYLALCIQKIVEHFASNPHELSVKNLLIVMIYFQVFAEIATLTNMLEDKQTFVLLVLSFICINGVLIGRLLMAYGASEKFNQLSIDFMLLTLGSIGFCSLEYISGAQQGTKKLFCWVAFLGSFTYFFLTTYRKVGQIKRVLSQ